ncbi:polysaccharide pyruvyl transferase family protein [Azohydromonas australica]|uniref:polysaccharide pyruvyl transferase family protein n=1 Tax=Azohydromonas australica TaxID=364039 RepID=UPI0006869B15|nr:polysaccharide pyruvyl transferase family protein [Azohydromonas australica]
MKLWYFKDPLGNFGDDLNPWLWDRLLPGFLDADESEWFVGIGTLLNHRLPVSGVKHVFGSGYGYGSPPDFSKGGYAFHAVRGPATAKLLGLDADTAITDAAVLLARVELSPVERVRGRIGFIPHCVSSRHYDWSTVCRDLGFTYIYAGWDVEIVLQQLRSCELVLCEAMHGAIAADTLRVPWIPVTCYPYIDAFKWNDWLSTLSLSYAPHKVHALYASAQDSSLTQQLKDHAKRTLHAMGLWRPHWTAPGPRQSNSADHAAAVAQLLSASKQRPMLSDASVIDSHINRYLERLEKLRHGSGRHHAAKLAT